MRNAIHERLVPLFPFLLMNAQISKTHFGIRSTFNEEYKAIENTIILTVEEVEMPETIIPEEVQDDLVNAITACPNGVFRFIPEIPEIVETSNNLSIITPQPTI